MENRDIRKTIRLTKDEENILIKAAAENNMRLSDYIRYKLFNFENNSLGSATKSIDFLIEYKKELALKKVETKDIYNSHKITEKINLLNDIIDYFSE